MRLERNPLARLLGAVTKVVEARNTIPILSTVRLVAEDGTLTATATDLDIEISSKCPAEGDFAACIDAKLLTGIVAKLSGDEVTIDATDNGAVLKCGRSRFTLQTLPITDYPSFSADGFATTINVDLAAFFSPVQFAISTEETRYYLNGIYLHVDGGTLTAVATDGHRLARNTGPDSDDFEGVIVPRKAVGLLPKGELGAAIGKTKIRFTQGDTVITSKLIDGTFPDYKRILPTGNDKIVTFDADAMSKSASRVSLVSSERGRAVKLAIAADTVTLTVNNPEKGSAAEDVVAAYSAEPIEIGFNAAYLTELLGIFPAGDVSLALADSGSPALFTAKGAPGLLCVLMPMRV